MELLPVSSPPQTGGGGMRYRIETRSLSYNLPAASCRDSLLHWCGLHGAPARPILRDVTCEARPGELLAIVGPSGAGKTTLLSVLAGVIQPSEVSGKVLVNGKEMDVARFRRISSYVAQDDGLFPLLTVKESLTYSARLRLGAGHGEQAARAQGLLRDLGLDHVAGSRIGSHGEQGISGGERRRVSIGVDLVHDPAVLLLDEPTSGLDSVSALHIITMLKSMAVIHSKTIILTIHQPGFRILELFDSILLISDGAVRHKGSLNSLKNRLSDSGLRIPHHVNVLEFAMDTISCLSIDHSQENREQSTKSTKQSIKENKLIYANSRCREVAILAERFSKNILRTKQLFAARMIQAVVAGFGLGTIFMNVSNLQARVGFFAFSLTFLLSSTTEGLPIYLQERRILMKETSTGAYRVSSYVLANALVFLPFLLFVALLYSLPVYWLVGLRREMGCFLYFSLVVWMVMLMANSFATFFAALVPDFIMGNSVIAGFMGSFFLFSGYFIAKESIPKYWIFMHYLSLFKYPFEAFLVNEYAGPAGRRECVASEGAVCVMTGDVFLRQQGLEEEEKWRKVGVMMGFTCGYRLLCMATLWFRCHRMRR